MQKHDLRHSSFLVKFIGVAATTIITNKSLNIGEQGLVHTSFTLNYTLMWRNVMDIIIKIIVALCETILHGKIMLAVDRFNKVKCFSLLFGSFMHEKSHIPAKSDLPQ